MRCLCTVCLLEITVRLLRSGRVDRGTRLVEMALQREQERAERERPVAAPPRTCNAEGRA
jgi:hypothetical protein